jgi:hypothetical protein
VALPLVPAVAIEQSRGPALGRPPVGRKAAINEPEERLDGAEGVTAANASIVQPSTAP